MEVVNFTLLPLYPRGKRSRYPLDKLGGPHIRFGRYGGKKDLHLLGIETRAIQTIAIPTELSRFLINERTVLRKV
jgi:hypothetical protein